MSKNLNSAFTGLTYAAALGTKPAWRVEFKHGRDNARTIVPINFQDEERVEAFMIMERRVGRGQIVRMERTTIAAQ